MSQLKNTILLKWAFLGFSFHQMKDIIFSFYINTLGKIFYFKELTQQNKQLDKQSTGGSNTSKNTEKLKKKIIFVANMIKMQKTLREQSESIIQLKGACPDKRLPRGVLTAGKSAIMDALADFNLARNADIVNEKMPTQAPQQSISINKSTNSTTSNTKKK